jgi:16S rRNA (guanine527-N7)-methyltransferase
MNALEFWTLCSANGIVLDDEQMRNFDRYHGELLTKNKSINLVSRTDTDNVWDRHILHSLAVLRYADIKPKARILDIGTGGGFPGLPLKIARPDLHATLVDSIAKKSKATQMFALHTGLRNVVVKTVRAESLADHKEFVNAFDVITARAVAPLVQLLSWAMPLVRKPAGYFAFLKGGDLTVEIEEAAKKFPELDYAVHLIEMNGYSWFAQQDKKVVVCRFRPAEGQNL